MFKQAPRIFLAVLPALETLVMVAQTPMYLRLYSWWMILQCWCTLRFCDHRSSPASATVQGSSLPATLSWSKTVGADSSRRSGPLVKGPSCYIHHAGWPSRRLQSESTLFNRDNFLPGPSKALAGRTKTEVRHDAAYAIQSRVMRVLPASLHPVCTTVLVTPSSSSANCSDVYVRTSPSEDH